MTYHGVGSLYFMIMQTCMDNSAEWKGKNNDLTEYALKLLTMETTNSIIDQPVYAGFWKRFAAHLIDSLIILIPLLTIITIIRNSGDSFDENDRMVLTVIFGWLYYAFSESSGAQATFGKRIMKIRVTGIDGNRIKFGKATGRFFGKFLSAIIVFMGFIMVAFTEKRQGLHDIMSGCLVTNSKEVIVKKEISPVVAGSTT